MKSEDIKKHVDAALELVKIKLSMFIALSALAGYMIQRPVPSVQGFQTAFSIFVLSGGCASLNNLQDRKRDCSSRRTCGRALPDKRLSPLYALVQSLILIITGLAMLKCLSYKTGAFTLGCVSIFLYNGLYTYLKPVSLFALIPGILCGMSGPLIGWTAAEGHMLDLRLWAIMVIIGLWQLPHIGLLVLSHISDYQKKNIPSFLRHVRTGTLKRMVFFWVLNLSAMMLFLIIQGVMISEPARVLIVFNAIFLVFTFARNYRSDPASSSPCLFIRLNSTMFVIMILPIIERIWLFH